MAGGEQDARDAVDIVGTESCCCCNSVVTVTAHAKVDAGAAQLISTGTASVRIRQMSCRWMWSADRERQEREGGGKGWVVDSLIIGRHETKPIALMANEMRTKLMDSLISEIILSACPRVRVSACLIISSDCHPKHTNSSCLQICIQNIRIHSLLLLV